MEGFHLEITYFLALFIGISLGLTGGGGSILTVPVLVYIASIEPVIATAYSLFVVGASSLVGAGIYYKKGFVNVRVAIIFAIPALITVWLMRKFVIHGIPIQMLQIGSFTLTRDLFLMLFFALIMLLSAYKMIFGIKREDHVQKKINHTLVGCSGLVVGVLSGLVGAGGGFLIVPALVFLMNLPIHLAIGTSLLIIAINSLIGFTGDVLNLTEIHWVFLSIFSIIAALGVIIGIYLNKYFDSEKLKKVFGYFVLIMALVIIIKELF